MIIEPVFLRVAEIDGKGRPVCRVVGTGDDGQLFPVLPGVTVFDPRDRKILQSPFKQDITPPSFAGATSLDGRATGGYVAGKTRELIAMRPGDVVRSKGFLGWVGDDKTEVAVHLGETQLLGNSSNDADSIFIVHLGEPDIDTLAKFRGLAEDAVETIEGDAFLARKRMEPGNALVIGWREVDGTIGGCILAHTGEDMYFAAECHDTTDLGMVPEPGAPGLCVLRNCKMEEGGRDWETGMVDDWHIEGDYSPITLEEAAAEFGFPDVEALRSKIEEQYPYIHEGDVLDALQYPEGDASAAHLMQ